MTIRRFAIAAVSFACLLIVALSYNRFFVRPISPEDANYRGPSAERDNVDGIGVLEAHFPELLPLFPDPNDWRRTSAIVSSFNHRQCFILSKGGPELSKDGRMVTMGTCTVVFLDGDPNKTAEERVRDSLVFESADKIELTFADPLSNFLKGDSNNKDFDLSKFETGKIHGEVVFRTRLGAADVVFRTRDVVFNAMQIHTNSDVSFSIGPNSGAGRGLTIDLETPYRLASRARRSADPENAEQEQQNEDPEDMLDKIAEEGNIGGGFSLKGIQLAELDGSLKFYVGSIAAISGDILSTKQGNAAEPESDDEESEADVDVSSVLAASGLVSDNALNGELDDAEEPEEEVDELSRYYVEARCKGSLYFSSNPNITGGWGLRFYKAVELVGFQDGVKSKQILCDTLYIYLQDKELAEYAQGNKELEDTIQRKKITGALSRLTPTNIRAVKGEDQQVVARDFDSSVELLSDEVQYDLERFSIDLISEDEPVRIRQFAQTNTLDFSSQNVRVMMNDLGEIESVYAGGTGSLVLKTRADDGSVQTIEAGWRDGVQAAPAPSKDPEKDEGYLRVTTSGMVVFQSESLGSFRATEGDAWCKLGAPVSAQRDPNAPLSFSPKALADMRPVCVDFRKNVVFRSIRGSAIVQDSAQVRFETRYEEEPAPVEEETSDEGAFGVFVNDSDREPVADPLKDVGGESLFEISAKTLEARCLLRYYPNKTAPKFDVARLTLRGDVLFRECVPGAPQERVRLQAGAVKIDNPNSDAMKILLLGTSQERALFKTEKLSLAGSNITVDGSANFFQVSGAGRLELASPVAKAQTAPTAETAQNVDQQGGSQELGRYLTEEPINIVWTNSMQFDGKKLSFISDEDKNVVVSQGTQRLLSPEVRLTLKDPMSIFKFDVKNKDDMNVETIECVGNSYRPVDIEVRSLPSADPKERASYFHALAKTLSFNVLTGKFVVNGDGRFYALVPTEGDSIGSIGETLNAKEQPAFGVKDAEKWTKINARFNGDIAGSIGSQEATIADGFRAVVASVADPNATLDVDDLSVCPEGTIQVESREAYMRLLKESGNTAQDRTTKLKQDLEVEARNNVVFRQKDITGICDSLRFSSLKNTLVLTGSRSSKASIYKQAYNGAAREELGSFSRAIYQLDTQKFNIESFTYGE